MSHLYWGIKTGKNENVIPIPDGFEDFPWVRRIHCEKYWRPNSTGIPKEQKGKILLDHEDWSITPSQKNDIITAAKGWWTNAQIGF